MTISSSDVLQEPYGTMALTVRENVEHKASKAAVHTVCHISQSIRNPRITVFEFLTA